MGVRPTFKMKVMRSYLQREEERLQQAITLELAKLGAWCVDKARTEGDYNNWTNNLRSSIGYILVKDGVILTKNFKKTGDGTLGDGSEGMRKGIELAEKLAGSSKKRYALILVVGETYAAYVESRGRNVFTSYEQMAAREWPKLRRQLKKNLDRRRF